MYLNQSNHGFCAILIVRFSSLAKKWYIRHEKYSTCTWLQWKSAVSTSVWNFTIPLQTILCLYAFMLKISKKSWINLAFLVFNLFNCWISARKWKLEEKISQQYEDLEKYSKDHSNSCRYNMSWYHILQCSM